MDHQKPPTDVRFDWEEFFLLLTEEISMMVPLCVSIDVHDISYIKSHDYPKFYLLLRKEKIEKVRESFLSARYLILINFQLKFTSFSWSQSYGHFHRLIRKRLLSFSLTLRSPEQTHLNRKWIFITDLQVEVTHHSLSSVVSITLNLYFVSESIEVIINHENHWIRCSTEPRASEIPQFIERKWNSSKIHLQRRIFGLFYGLDKAWSWKSRGISCATY